MNVLLAGEGGSGSTALRDALEKMVRHVVGRAAPAREKELSRQLAGRKTVDRAKGILMEVRGLSEGDAYRLLRRESQNRRVPLAEVASTVVSMEGVFRAGTAKGGA